MEEILKDILKEIKELKENREGEKFVSFSVFGKIRGLDERTVKGWADNPDIDFPFIYVGSKRKVPLVEATRWLIENGRDL